MRYKKSIALILIPLIVFSSIFIIYVSLILFRDDLTRDRDTIKPLVTINNPNNMTYSNATQLLNITATDNIGIDTICYNWNGTNMTFTSPLYITFDEGINYLTAWANDSAGNLGLTLAVFIIDKKFPSLKINNPTNTTYNNATRLLNITATDNIDFDKIWYNWNGTNMTYVSPLYITFNEGSNTIRSWVNDSVGHINSTSISFIIDTTLPIIEITSPLNTIYGEKRQLLTISASDNTAIDTVWYNWNGTNMTYTSPIYINFNEGTNIVHAWVNDSAGNIESTSIVFTVDKTFPVIKINNPINIIYPEPIQLLNITATDDIAIDRIWYNWNGINMTYISPLYIMFNEGLNMIIVWANDSVGNVGSTSISFNIDTTNPSIKITNPQNKIYFGATRMLNITANDNVAIDMIWYNWNGMNITYTFPININFNEGSNTIHAWVNDTVGHTVSTSMSFIIKRSFNSTWDTTKISTGSTNVTQIKLPLEQDGNYDFIVDWGDGNKDKITIWNQSEVLHNYELEGIYNITINGTIIGWRFNGDGDKLKIIDIKEWGHLRLGNSGDYFSGCEKLKISATDVLNLRGTNNMKRAFFQCRSITTVLGMNEWNTTNITDMSYMFSQCRMNQDISDWDVSNVRNMSNMFHLDSRFNQPIGGWDVSNVRDMSYMFATALYFNQNIGSWNVSSVTNMKYMFSKTDHFNQDIGDWDVSKVIDMSYMFYWAEEFNGSLENWIPSNVIEMNHMFWIATKFNKPISNWNVSNVRDMSYMFEKCRYFNHYIGDWDVSRVIDMEGMFSDATNFNQDIGDWDVSNVNDMEDMFREAFTFNHNIEGWDVSSVIDMKGMFSEATNFNQDIGDWDVSNVIYMFQMFYGASSFNQDLNKWNISNVRDICGIFRDALSFNQSLSKWDISNLEDLDHFFHGASNFNQNISCWNVSSATDMSYMFQDAVAFNQDIGNWNVSSVKDMSYMFEGANLFNQDIGSWNVSNVIDMSGMFANNDAFNQDISSWDVSSVIDMSYMFDDADAFNQNIGSWNVSSVTDMSFMFFMTEVFNQDIGSWNVSSVITMDYMFYGITLSTINYENLLIGWSSLTLQPEVHFHGGNSRYSAIAALARESIINNYNWTIIDGGMIE